MSTAPFLGFDLLEEAQALKHVTINEALLAIDTFLDEIAIADISGLQTALDGKVNLTGNETISGIKTFSSAPNLSSLTASRPLSLDSSKNITSLSAADFATLIGLGTGNSPIFTGVFSTSAVFGVTTAPTSPGTLTVVRAAAYNSEGNQSIRIFNAGTSPSVVLQMGADATNAIGFIQAMQPGVAWSTRALVLQGNGGAVSIGTITNSARVHIRGAGTTTGVALRVENSGGTARLLVQDDGLVTLSGLLQLDSLTASRLLELNGSKQLASVGFASSDIARLTTDQTIGGIKTFSSAPVLSSLTASARVRTGAGKALESVTGDAIFSDSGIPLQFGTIDTMPSGADSAEGWIAAPYSPADGTTSMTMRIRGIRVYCTGGTTTNSATFIIEKSSDGGQTWSEVGGAANTSTTVASASRTGSKTSFGTAPTFASGDLLRVSGSGGSGREDIIVALDCQRTA